MQKILKNICLAILAGLLSVSCEDELDVNKNLNNPTSPSASLFLTAAEASLATVLGGELTNYGGFMAQYHTQAPGAGQYNNIDNYNVSSSFGNGIWREAYAGGINDLDKVIELSDGNTGNLLIARLLRVYYFQVLTDFFGDIPYSVEALSGLSNLNPEVIRQQEIYESLIKEVQDVVANYNANPIESTFGEQDVLLNGDMDKWIRFANTLLLKMNLRLSETPQVNSTAINNLLAANNFLEENVDFAIYTGEANRSNPFFDVQLDRLGGRNHVASNSLWGFLFFNDDSRLVKKYVASDSGGIDQGARGDHNGQTAFSFAGPRVRATQPVYLFSTPEINFMQAEALLRYQGGVGAKEKYEAGVVQSFLLHGNEEEIALGTPQEDAKIVLESFYAFKEMGSIEEKLEQIIVQKWVANAYVNTIESYFDQLRTGYPQFVPRNIEPDYSLGRLRVSQSSVFISDTSVPLSMFYSQQEVDANKNLDQKPSLTQPIWWDQ